MNTHANIILEQAIDFASLWIHINVEVARRGGQTRDGLDIRSQSVTAAISLTKRILLVKLLTCSLLPQPTSRPG